MATCNLKHVVTPPWTQDVNWRYCVAYVQFTPCVLGVANDWKITLLQMAVVLDAVLEIIYISVNIILKCSIYLDTILIILAVVTAKRVEKSIKELFCYIYHQSCANLQ